MHADKFAVDFVFAVPRLQDIGMFPSEGPPH